MKENELIIKYNTIPNKENIFYAFQRLITPIAIATAFEPYKESWNQFNKILNIIKNWAIIYDTSKDLSQINSEEIKQVDDLLYDLDGKYLSYPGLYAEDAYIWLEQIKILRNNELERKNK